jgi:hypothetical protein
MCQGNVIPLSLELPVLPGNMVCAEAWEQVCQRNQSAMQSFDDNGQRISSTAGAVGLLWLLRVQFDERGVSWRL